MLALTLSVVTMSQEPDFIPDAALKEIGPLDGSYAQCILKEMPGVASDLAATQIRMQCIRAYPDGLRTIERGSALFGYRDGPSCVAKKARDTASREAARMIAIACYKRYGPLN